MSSRFASQKTSNYINKMSYEDVAKMIANGVKRFEEKKREMMTELYTSDDEDRRVILAHNIMKIAEMGHSSELANNPNYDRSVLDKEVAEECLRLLKPPCKLQERYTKLKIDDLISNLETKYKEDSEKHKAFMKQLNTIV
jgi:hypothetical protein